MNPAAQTNLASSDDMPSPAESPSELQELANAMPQLVWIADKDGQVTYYNQQVHNYAGAYQDAEGHWRWAGLVHAEDLEKTAAAWQKALETGETYSMEHRIQMVNGDYRWHLSRALRRKGSGYKEEKWFGTATDIHEHKSAEQALQNAYAQLQTLYNSGQIQVSYLKAIRNAAGEVEDLEVLTINPATEAVVPDAAPKALVTQLFPGLKEQPYWQHVMEVIETGVPQRLEAFFEYGPQPAWYDNYYTRYDDGVIIQSININERKMAEAEIRKAHEATEQQKRLYETVTDNTPDLIYVFDLNYCFTFANKALLQMWGKTWDEAIGKGLLENGYEPWHAEMHQQEIDQVVATKMPIRGTVSFPHATLGSRVYDYIFSPVFNEAGDVEAVAGTTRDITEQKIAEAAIRKSENQFRTLAEKLEHLVAERTAELLRSNADLQQFAHVASHDLKEPIRKIKTFAGMLEKKLNRESESEAVLFLDKINSAANRMAEMVDGVLAYSSLNAGERPVEKIDLSETIRSIESDVEVTIARQKAHIACAPLPAIEGAPVLIYQLFYNLINNSLKFAKADEPLRINITCEDAVLGDAPATLLRVTDNGIGFEQEYAERIFDTFLRLHAKDRYEGTGLGLALCKKIVERHGGQIEAESEVGKGASFFVTLPLRQGKGNV